MIVLSLITLTLFPSAITTAHASAFSYAIILDGACLYSIDESGEFNPVSSLPKDYFVMLAGNETAGYVPVRYLDLDGFVRSSDILTVDYEPKYKYAEKNSLTVKNDGNKINLRSSPTHQTGNIVLTLDSEDVAYYYGTVKGSTQISALGDEWYYIKVTKDGVVTRGYIYNLYADATPITPNIIEKIENNQPSNETTEENALPSPENSTREIVIIVSLCLPAFVALYLLFRQPS